MKKREHVQFITSLTCCSWFSADFNLSRTCITKKKKKKIRQKITTVYERQYIIHNIQQYIHIHVCKIQLQIAGSHSHIHVHVTKYPCSPSKLYFCQIACYSFNTQIFRGIITFIQLYKYIFCTIY